MEILGGKLGSASYRDREVFHVFYIIVPPMHLFGNSAEGTQAVSTSVFVITELVN